MNDTLSEKMYQSAVQYQEMADVGSLNIAQKLFEKLESYRDSANRAQNCSDEVAYLTGVEAYENGNYEDALNAFYGITDYKDTMEYLKEYQYVPVAIDIANNLGKQSAYVFEYGQDGKMTAAKFYFDASADEPTATYLFDAAGRVIERPKVVNYSHLRYTTNSDGTVLEEYETKGGWIGNSVYDFSGHKTASYSSLDKKWTQLEESLDKYGNYYKNCKNGYDRLENLVSVEYRSGNLVKNSAISYIAHHKIDDEAPDVIFDMDLIWKNIRIICGEDVH